MIQGIHYLKADFFIVDVPNCPSRIGSTHNMGVIIRPGYYASRIKHHKRVIAIRTQQKRNFLNTGTRQCAVWIWHPCTSEGPRVALWGVNVRSRCLGRSSEPSLKPRVCHTYATLKDRRSTLLLPSRSHSSAIPLPETAHLQWLLCASRDLDAYCGGPTSGGGTPTA